MAKELLRALPSIESLLASPFATRLSADWNRDRVRDLLREILDEYRQEILSKPATGQEFADTGSSILPTSEIREIPDFFAEIESRLASRALGHLTPSLRRVINATG